MAEFAPGLKLRRAREAQRPKPSQYDVADLVGVKRPTYNAWESGRNQPDPRIVTRLAHLWGFPEAWVWDGLDTPLPLAEVEPALPPGTLRVPYWGEVPGMGWEAPLDLKTISVSGALDPEGAIAVRIAGNAMAPLFHHGQILVGRRTTQAVEGLVHLCKGPGGRLELCVARAGRLDPLHGQAVPGESWEVLARIVHVEFTDLAGIRGEYPSVFREN